MRPADPHNGAVRPKVLLVDVGSAIVAAIIILAITPGLAVTAPVAIVVLALCGISFTRGKRHRLRAQSARQRTARPARQTRS